MTAPAASPTVSRRTALGALAGAAAAFTIVNPRAVRGDDANRKLTLGVVGLGGRGAWIAGLFQKHGGYQIAAVADYFQPVADAAGERFGVPANRRFSGLSGYRKVIDAKVDAVVLETPPCFFPAHVKAAVAAGCHVYMAKPVAVDVPGCLAVLAAAKTAASKGKTFLIDFQTRTDPYFQEAMRLVHDGVLGPVSMMSSAYTDEGHDDPPKRPTIEDRLQRNVWGTDHELGGGPLVTAGIHAIDISLWAAGRLPVSAMGIGTRGRKNPQVDAHDCFSLSYDYGAGLIHNHRGEHVKNLHGFACSLQVFGQDAVMEGAYDGKTWVHGVNKSYKGGMVVGLYQAGAERNIATFHKSVLAGDASNPTVEPSVNAALACILGREAAFRGAKLTWAEMMKEQKRYEADLTGLRE